MHNNDNTQTSYTHSKMHIALCNNKTWEMKEPCKKMEEEALPLTTSSDVFPEFCLEVAWYLAVDNWCGFDVKIMLKIKALMLISW